MTQPEDFIGRIGDTVSFCVEARGENLTYQWQVSTDGGSSWYDSTGGGYATPRVYGFQVTETRVGNLYRCKVTDGDGNVVYSEPGKIILLTEDWTNTYNADGLRTRRTNGSKTYEYVYNGGQLTRMTVGDDVLTFGYNANGSPMYVQWNDNARYYYVTNLQGDVTAIVSVNGICVVEYTYDAWGNVLSVTGLRADNLGALNPLRYRGYVYDTESTLYYFRCRWGMALTSDNQLFSCIFRHDGVPYRHQLIRR